MSSKIPSGAPRRAPDTLVLLFALAIVLWALAHVLPAGQFLADTQAADGKPLPIALDQYQPTASWRAPQLFSEDDHPGLLNALFDGLTSGTRNGSAIGVIAFLLIVGGAFNVILRTGCIEGGLLWLVAKTERRPQVLLATLVVAFSSGGAVLGMGDEVLAYVAVLGPMFARLGYAPAITVMCTYVASQIGFGTSWMNPFSVIIAQGIAGVPVLSGSTLRVVMWAFFTGFLIVWLLIVTRHHKTPARSDEAPMLAAMPRRHDGLLMAMLGLGLIWIVWGVSTRGYFIPQLAAQMFAIGIGIGVTAVILKVGELTLSDVSKAFTEGAANLLPCVLVIALAKSLVLLLGGADPQTPSILNYLLFVTGNALQGLPPIVAAQGMLLFQSTFNFFVPSGSAQAAITMPLMAPLSDLIGVTRQVAVLCFQLGDGLSNIVIPTSAGLVGAIGMAKLDWLDWIRYVWRFAVALFVVAALFVAAAVEIGYA